MLFSDFALRVISREGFLHRCLMGLNQFGMVTELSQRLKNLAASLVLISATVLVYSTFPYFSRALHGYSEVSVHVFRHEQVALAVALVYSMLLAVFYLTEKKPRVSKSIACLSGLARLVRTPRLVWQGGLPADERLGLLSVLLKSFFAPLMVIWLFDHLVSMFGHGVGLSELWGKPGADWLSLFNLHGFWFLFQVILFLDVMFFTVGYLIELPALKNEIRSVDPTLLGWGVALACYPPFNGLTSSVFGWHTTDFPQFGHPGVHLAANLLLLALMAVYTSASVALNLKASNLTHRGIIAQGPYRFIRHPAYVCKNLAWWIGLGPALIIAVQTSLTATLTVFGSMVGWSFFYIMRALTEEDHLRSVDGDYEAYCQKVKYRFVPGVI